MTARESNWGEHWLKSGHAVATETATGVLEAIGRIAASSVNAHYVWRGVDDARFSVEASVLRADELAQNPGREHLTEADIAAYEDHIVDRARQWGIGFGTETFPTYLSALALIQHHGGGSGIGTRLVDVSSNPITSLWFATASCLDEHGRERDGILMALNRAGLPEFGTHSSQAHTFHTESGLVGGFGTIFDIVGDGPFIVRPEFPGPRMVAQSSLFITSRFPAPGRRRDLQVLGFDGVNMGDPADFHPLTPENAAWIAGRAEREGEAQPVKYVAIVIRGEFKSELREVLRNTYEVSERVVYPDVQGFVDSWRAHGLARG